MRLGNMLRLPNSISGFIVDFLESTPPRVDGIVVKLPYADDARLHPLTKVQGFVFITGGPDPCVYFVHRHRLFEMPEVVWISDELLEDIEVRGEEVFLEGLRRLRKPAVIDAAERSLGGPGETLEIGSTFAYPLPWPWEMILDGKWGELGTRAWAMQGLIPDSVHKGLIPGTQEYFTGLRLFIQDMARKFSSRRVPFWVASGEISTAGHQRTVPLNGPHIVAPSNTVPVA
ncbi:MAG: hypothetical protein A3B37_02840 [Candidatus Sungbacteria bacterium RIFCSPLOWO2_01_FULL_59_16]|uniref:Uncharacterized protein n=1 Tax=Candidatus Sungbacteria bacterium RIFCSPLOWO2_01_FULL_59_16 TaxID=1802280 RepID=A0A1G2L9G5_9BACT|nr:MAG: hypothetical protein A3B37_02840 [Candidatus Sungbacteria bacterium RIFCSPLOWO2_01_FULL_59_16]